MKYMLMCFAAAIVCFGGAYGLARLVRAKTGKPGKGAKTLIATIVAGIVILLVASLAYLGIYYHAGKKAEAALGGSSDVTVQTVEGGFLFDGPGSDRALVFYPGAKVEAKAYAPLMLKLSEQGIDCFLADMPFNFALLGGNAADAFISAYDYDTWIMAGHSMGGIAASSYAEAHPDAIDGVVLLASYTTTALDGGMKVCSVYGSLDGCLNQKEYEANRGNWPADAEELVIEGGNHAQFGDYGNQSGDGTALISDEEQQDATVKAICALF